MIDFTYLTQPPKRYTFEQPQLLAWVRKWCDRGFGSTVLNLFAGKVPLRTLTINEYRVDIDPTCVADYHGDAYEFVRDTKTKFDVVVLDPPYNIRKAREKYESRWIGKLTKIKNILPNILNKNGRVISLGYDTVGMSKSRGFKKIAICLVCHGGDHNDTIGLVEEVITKAVDE